ncbi:torsin-1A-interacting protein 2-like isoform X2 [Hemibagrus wyckioides]|uniref:torsin-1A-interacting protein 2-like isoform X2 n=1 Tax=Hemibagrus wyckioides TaxID=337641 RepID=UPI00266C4872|nr:torsin-1A-interacting protein 2-like isoform X2 [Hemibagrus wyckioides]
MDRVDLKRDGTDVRRSTRLLQNKGVFPIDLRPRGALKRKRDVTALIPNEECGTEEGSPDKMAKVQLGKDAGDGHENGDQSNTVEMDVEEPEDQNQDMSSEDESGNSKPQIQEESIIKAVRVGNLETEEIRAFLQRQRKTNQMSQATKPSKLTGCGETVYGSQNVSREPSTTGSASVEPKPLENKTDILSVRSSIREYRNKMEEKARGISGVNLQGRDRYPYVKDHPPSRQPPPSLKKTPSLKTNNIPVKKQLHHPNTEVRKKLITKTGSTSPSRDAWGVCRWFRWAVFLLASLALGLMGYQHFPSSFNKWTSGHQNRLLYGATFEAYLAELKTLFPSQRPELWNRTMIHIKRHLNLTDPTEPVSLMLTSGREAEKTLGCLAQHLAAAFSSTFNSSVLGIDGTSKSAQDSDQVKMDIDKALKEAFEGGTKAAVIHRFEELPPGSTLIFYRYCDHENSAFKKVFLAFTVMLEEEVAFSPNANLGMVEEMVQEYLKKKFVSSDRTAKFNQMDVDKLSGLWSRISHLILPVAPEQKIEQQGC